MTMSIEEIKSRLQAELPQLLKQDVGFRDWLEQLIRTTAVTPESFDARFERFMQELAADREERQRQREADQIKWQALAREWQEQNRRWAEQEQKWQEQSRKWEAQELERQEQNRKWEAHELEQNRKWEALELERQEQNRRWAEQEQKWQEQSKINRDLLAEIKLTRYRYDQGIGALGARWGIASEQSFRDALKSILEESFAVTVMRLEEFDDEGTVFGRPDQVEIDVIIKNGMVIICELKSSVSKSEVYTFDRKVQYFERRHARPVTRKIIVSPMVLPTARALAEGLGMEVFSYAEDATVLAEI